MPNKPRDRPTVPQVAPLMARVYQRHAAGCCAHLVLDDGNVEDHSAQFCLQWALDKGHPDCIELCEALVKMTRTQRLKLRFYDLSGVKCQV